MTFEDEEEDDSQTTRTVSRTMTASPAPRMDSRPVRRIPSAAPRPARRLRANDALRAPEHPPGGRPPCKPARPGGGAGGTGGEPGPGRLRGRGAAAGGGAGLRPDP